MSFDIYIGDEHLCPTYNVAALFRVAFGGDTDEEFNGRNYLFDKDGEGMRRDGIYVLNGMKRDEARKTTEAAFLQWGRELREKSDLILRLEPENGWGNRHTVTDTLANIISLLTIADEDVEVRIV
jgi:hypothetical protein